MKQHKINQEIAAPEVFLVDQNGKTQGVVSIDQALYLSYEAGLDLVEINPSAKPPIAKIMDYGKYLYAQEKQASKQKTKAKAPELKEIRVSLKIDEHDLDFKTKQAQKFLADGDKVKLSMRLIGREMMFQDKAYKLIEEFAGRSGAKAEGKVERMGNRFSAVLVQNRGKENETKNS